MPVPTQPFRDEHAERLVHIDHIRQVARELDRVSLEERRTMLTRVLGFLRATLLHAEAEDAVLHPEWARLVGAPDASAPMSTTTRRSPLARTRLGRADVEDLEQVKELLYGLHGLIRVHFRKEEDLQLPLLDAHPEIAEEILKRMSAHAHHPDRTTDPPPQKHAEASARLSLGGIQPENGPVSQVPGGSPRTDLRAKYPGDVATRAPGYCPPGSQVGVDEGGCLACRSGAWRGRRLAGFIVRGGGG